MKNFILGFGAFLLLAVLAAPYFWPPELNLVFNSLFWASSFLFIWCAFVVGYLFYSSGGSSRGTSLYFGISLIISASVMHGGLEQVASNIEFWEPHFSATYGNFFLLLTQLIFHAKNIVSFGFAAIGASIVASAIMPLSGVPYPKR